MHHSIALLAGSLAIATAKVVTITAGVGGLHFSPESSTAEVGDTLEFHFNGGFHTVVQGDFSTPCHQGSFSGSGFNSGPIKNGADGSGSVFQVKVTDTNPIWFYCGTPTHCQSGMVGAINAPSSGNTLDAYKSAAAGTSDSSQGSSPQGGVVVPVGTKVEDGSSSSSSSSTVVIATTSSPSVAGTSSSPVTSSTLSSVSSASTPLTSSKAAGTTTSAVVAVSSSSSVKASTTTTPAATSKTGNATTSPTIVPANGATGLVGSTTLVGAVLALGFALLLI